MPGERGSYRFEIDAAGRVTTSSANLSKLASLFRDGAAISGEWGPGNPGDFDNGSWHIACHLVAGAGVLDSPGGRIWCGITHDPNSDLYRASIVFRDAGQVRVEQLGSAAATQRLSAAKVIAFIEGSSQGHIAARGARDASTAFNGWPRQRFDQDVSSAANGGTVWEQWCTTRDIRDTSSIGSSVVAAYLELVSLLGGRFVAAVARGRREHEHPRHLVALVRAGLLTESEATWDITPVAISPAQQQQLYEAREAECLAASMSLTASAQTQTYYMYQRRIDRWSDARSVERDLRAYP